MIRIKGFDGLPDIRAVLPTKQARLSLTPLQQVVLHSVLSQALETPELFPSVADFASVIEELEGQLSDRLTFEDAK